MSQEQVCGGASRLIFACSGAADVGAVADRVARQLSQDGLGKMYCLAGVGGHVPGIIKTTESAECIVAIDGCPLDCAKKSLEQAGIQTFTWVRLTDMGLEKGKTAVNEETVKNTVEKVKGLIK